MEGNTVRSMSSEQVLGQVIRHNGGVLDTGGKEGQSSQHHRQLYK